MRRDVAPAAPPAAKLPAKNFQNCLSLSMPSMNIFLYVSLKAKLSACVGKYLKQSKKEVQPSEKMTHWICARYT